VQPGAAVNLEIELDWSMLDVRAGGDWITESGNYVLGVGRHAGDSGAVTVIVHR
jgi:hypothetical protein